jgi:hypothetical protein
MTMTNNNIVTITHYGHANNHKGIAILDGQNS